MARIDDLNHFLTDVADAIREKKGTEEEIFPANFDTEISNISTMIGEEITITPSTSEQVITPSQGKNAITQATVSAVTSSIDSDIKAENIKSGVTILGVNGTYNGGKDTLMNVNSNVNVNNTTLVFNEYWPDMTELQYIQSSGTQYINTGVQTSSDIEVEVKCYWIKSNSGMGRLVGTPSDCNFELASSNNGNFRWAIGGASGSASVPISSNIIHTVKLTGTGLCYVDSVQKANLNKNIGTYTLFILAGNGPNNEKGVARLYSVKVKKNDTLVRDMIPVKDKDNIVCMYDNVSQTYFYNAGTGTFIAGPEV